MRLFENIKPTHLSCPGFSLIHFAPTCSHLFLAPAPISLDADDDDADAEADGD